MSTDESLGCGRRRRSRQLWVLAAFAVAILVLASVATQVAAHAYLSDSNPENGEQVDTVPDEVTLTFSGDGVQVADATVTGPDGEDVSGEAEVDPDDSQLVRIPLDGATSGEAGAEEAATDGMYTVSWEILADDGHTVSGSFFFTVGDEPLDRDAVLAAYEDNAGPDDDTSAIEAGAKGLLLLSLIALIGAPITAAVAVYPAVIRYSSADSANVMDTAARSMVDRRLVRLLATAGTLLLVSVVALGLARATAIDSLSTETLTEFLETPLGRAWLVQLGGAVLLCAVLVGAFAGALSRRGWLAGTAVSAVLVGGTISWTSHSATAIDRLQGTAVDFAHIGGAGLWVGGLVVLALVVPPALRETGTADRRALAAVTIRRYSLLALAGVTLAGATGLVLAAWHVPSLSALSDSLYGVSLSAKTLLVLLALGLGGLTRFVLLRRLDPPAGADCGIARRLLGGRSKTRVREDGGQSGGSPATTAFVRAVRFEVAVLVVVLLVSGLLTSVPTATIVDMDDDGLEMATIEREGPEDLTTELLVAPAAAQGTDAGDGDLQLTVRPDEPVVFEVTFLEPNASADDGGRDRIASDRPVRLLADATDGETTIDVAFEETEDGSYATVQTLPDEGAWDIRITGAPADEFVTERYDILVEPVSSNEVADHDNETHDNETHDGEHDDQGTDHEHERDADGDSNAVTPFTVVLQFGAVAVGVIGSVAVAVEAIRLRDGQ